MKLLASIFVLISMFPLCGWGETAERLGTVDFQTSCAVSQQQAFNRGVALLHDFWYEEAGHQFKQIADADPTCAMAHWGIAMSIFHQIWNRPDEGTMKHGWSEIEEAQTAAAKTARERQYIGALQIFYQPGKQDYQARAEAYSAAMSKLHSDYPDDVDAAAFYGLSLLADIAPEDASVTHQQETLELLRPLFAKYPDHPGLAHYIIHACDNPQLAKQGLEAAERYGKIAPSAAHSAHMPSHIFARLGMWQEDIGANVNSVAAAERAFSDHPSAIFDQLHAEDFLLYAYLQSAQDAKAKEVIEKTNKLFAEHGGMSMPGMRITFFRTEFPTFYALERRDWTSAAALTPAPAAGPLVKTETYWARIVADGHLHRGDAARADLETYKTLMEEVRKSDDAFVAGSTGAQIVRNEILAWAAFAQSENETALTKMQAAADLQDKVGQREVDIPAREMLADMLLELDQPQKALAEYQIVLHESPNRFNGLFNAGRAAEKAGDHAAAAKFYTTLLKSTNNGRQSSRPEFAHVNAFLNANQVAGR